MGDSKPMQWIVGIVIYFTVYFLVTLACYSIKAEVYAIDPIVNFNASNFYEISKYVDAGGKCDVPSRIGSFTSLLPSAAISCHGLAVNNLTCGEVIGCNWVNDSFFLGDYCHGTVNRTYYGFTDRVPCAQIADRDMCAVFLCTWFNTTDLYNTVYDVGAGSTSSFFGTAFSVLKFMIGWKPIFGFRTFGWLWAFFFTFIPFLLLVFAIYKTVVSL